MEAALLDMMSEMTTITRPELADYVLNFCESCDLGQGEFIKTCGSRLLGRERPGELVAKRLKRLTVKSFMDAWTLNVERLQQCCIHVGSTDGQVDFVRVPFCARQLFGFLRRKTSEGSVPAGQLIPLNGRKGARR